MEKTKSKKRKKRVKEREGRRRTKEGGKDKKNTIRWACPINKASKQSSRLDEHIETT